VQHSWSPTLQFSGSERFLKSSVPARAENSPVHYLGV
jgi:hypothetical protein